MWARVDDDNVVGPGINFAFLRRVLQCSTPRIPSIFAPTLTTLRSEFLRLISSFQGFSTPKRKSSRIAIRFDKLFLVSFTGEDIVSFQVRELFRVYCTSSPHFNGEL